MRRCSVRSGGGGSSSARILLGTGSSAAMDGVEDAPIELVGRRDAEPGHALFVVLKPEERLVALGESVAHARYEALEVVRQVRAQVDEDRARGVGAQSLVARIGAMQHEPTPCVELVRGELLVDH